MATKARPGSSNPVLASNRAASHEFHLLSRLEAGLVLAGPEVKSARAGRVNLKEAYAVVRGGEVWLEGAHFSPYENARSDALDPVRPRKLLLHAREIRKLAKQTSETGVTLVPTKLYLRDGRIKVEIAVARGKKKHDKRDDLRRRDAEREIARAQGARRG